MGCQSCRPRAQDDAAHNETRRNKVKTSWGQTSFRDTQFEAQVFHCETKRRELCAASTAETSMCTLDPQAAN